MGLGFRILGLIRVHGAYQLRYSRTCSKFVVVFMVSCRHPAKIKLAAIVIIVVTLPVGED